MRFGVLGPLTVWTGQGDQVRIPEAKVRALLADLLVHQGDPVSADRLIEDLWGDRPPGKPAGALRVKVSQLRKVLEEAERGGRDRLAFRQPGYLLDGPSDADRFHELTTLARQSDDPRIKAGLLGDALALWRGPAFADFRDEEFARPAIARLEEQRLVALEEHAETRLELGEHALLAAELADLVAEHPLRERLRAVHIRALYRAGRQSEALDSFTELRTLLLDELGVDPSPQLVELQRAILAQDPALAPVVPARTNLPTPATELIGRERAAAEVRSLLAAHRLVTLTGPGGVGKTRLALDVARRLEADFPGGVWLVELAALDVPSRAGVVHAVSAALSLRDDATGSRTADGGCRLSDAVRDKRLLLLLDNCEHVIEPVATLVDQLLRTAPGVRFLATSQEALNLTGEALWPVPPLDLPPAVPVSRPEPTSSFSSAAASSAASLGTPSPLTTAPASPSSHPTAVPGSRAPDPAAAHPAAAHPAAAHPAAAHPAAAHSAAAHSAAAHSAADTSAAGHEARSGQPPTWGPDSSHPSPWGAPGSADRTPMQPTTTAADVEAVTAIGAAGAVQLFVARAAAAVPGFRLDPTNAHDIADICRKLDGVPLAIELAATRMRVLSPRQLLERLDDRFRLLAAGRRDAPARQQTLRAMIDWSWELLSDRERQVLSSLAVHADGCTLEAAEAVSAGGEIEQYEVLDLLARLIDRSLVVTVCGAPTPGAPTPGAPTPGSTIPGAPMSGAPMSGATTTAPRYRLLESVAAYCVERLRESGDYEAVRARHLAYYTALAEQGDRRLRGHGQREWLARLDAEAPNIRAALDGPATRQQALRLANAMAWYWTLRGRYEEGFQSFDRALAHPGEADPSTLAEALAWRAGLMLQFSGCNGTLAESLAGLDQIIDPVRRALLRWYLAFGLWGRGDLQDFDELAIRALEEFESLGDRWGIAAGLSSRASIGLVTGDLAAATRDGERSAALFAELGDQCGVLLATGQLATFAEIAADYDRAAVLHEAVLTAGQDLELWVEVSRALAGLGRIALLRGDYLRADDLHEQARRLAHEQSNPFAEHFAEIGLALSARRQGRLDEAERHLTRWLDWLRMIEGDPGIALVLAELGFIAELRGRGAEAMALHLEGLECARATNDPRAVALAYEGLAGAEALAGNHRAAARLLGTASAARASVGVPLPAGERADVDRISALVRDALGEDVFRAEFHSGEQHPTSLPA
ncbi:BTAD domain-containing putative transcriptional regulator [Nonomuraea sp. NPDC050328]|uniref:BTAD domain-containing putative transcriptional regulator n=1 Tax=Nonomuraea sp. NPDC050328 TaxID=3364361 RepID=UPI0037BDAC7B